MRWPLARGVITAAVVAATLPGCSDDADTARAGDLPPAEVPALVDVYEEELAEHGMRLTDRGGLLDRANGYEVSEEGTHLALYLEPTDARDADAYLDGIVTLTALFAQDVFERWPRLETFDVCQERTPAEIEDGWPPTLSQVELTRETARSLDWETVELVDLLEATEDDPDSFVRVQHPLDQHADYLAAEEDAGLGGGGW